MGYKAMIPRLSLLLALFCVTWKQMEGQRVPYWSNLAQRPAPIEVVETDHRQFFDEKSAALDFIKDKDGDRKFWDFKLYECKEIGL